MQDKLQIFQQDSSPTRASELIAERKEQILAEQAERQANKDRNLRMQTCIDTPPEVRISLWEGRHGLALPRAAQHPLLRIIAADTGLELQQVRNEQRRRAMLRATPPVGHH